MARLLMNESWVRNRMRQTDEAIDTCQRALTLFETHQATEDIAQAHNNLAVFYESRQEMDLALQHNLKSMGLFTALNNKRKLANVSAMCTTNVRNGKQPWITSRVPSSRWKRSAIVMVQAPH